MPDDLLPIQENAPELIACGECDLLVRPAEVRESRHYTALCPRCGA